MADHKSDATDDTSLVHLLDMGREKYGDCVLCRFKDTFILVDGGHKGDIRSRGGFASIPDQLAELLGQDPPFRVSLLVVTHVHSDHIGCLPEMVEQDLLQVERALVADEDLGFGGGPGSFDGAAVDSALRRVVAALREESRADVDDDELDRFLSDAATLEGRYRSMLAALEAQNTRVVRYKGLTQDVRDLEREFSSVGLKVLGPTGPHLEICAESIAALTRDAADLVASALARDAAADEKALYRRLAAGPGRAGTAPAVRTGPARGLP